MEEDGPAVKTAKALRLDADEAHQWIAWWRRLLNLPRQDQRNRLSDCRIQMHGDGLAAKVSRRIGIPEVAIPHEDSLGKIVADREVREVAQGKNACQGINPNSRRRVQPGDIPAQDRRSHESSLADGES